MRGRLIIALVPAMLTATNASSGTHRHPPGGVLEQEVAALLREKTESVRCDGQHFIFGVGYIDGSYMERIFYVEGAGDRPSVSVDFRGAGLQDAEAKEQAPLDIAAVPFVVELQAPRVLHAVPTGEAWRVSDEGWETALRFKYTSWFGEVRRKSGEWRIDWKGYRRPMLPPSVTGNAEAICAMFEGR